MSMYALQVMTGMEAEITQKLRGKGIFRRKEQLGILLLLLRKRAMHVLQRLAPCLQQEIHGRAAVFC